MAIKSGPETKQPPENITDKLCDEVMMVTWSDDGQVLLSDARCLGSGCRLVGSGCGDADGVSVVGNGGGGWLPWFPASVINLSLGTKHYIIGPYIGRDQCSFCSALIALLYSGVDKALSP